MRIRDIVIIIAASYAAIMLVGHILMRFGVGPHWQTYHSSSGIEYACMFNDEQDFIDVTLDNNEDHYHEQQD